MKVIYSEKAKQGDMALLQQATRRLEEVVRGSAHLVTAEWDRIGDEKGRTLYHLKIGDFTGDVSTDFAPDELKNPLHLHVRLYRLWGDLLQLRSNKQHQAVQVISGQISDG